MTPNTPEKEREMTELRELIESMTDARDMLAGHLMGHQANAVTAGIAELTRLSEENDLFRAALNGIEATALGFSDGKLISRDPLSSIARLARAALSGTQQG